MGIFKSIISIFKKKEIKPEEDKITALNHKINSLQNDITLIKLNNNQILQILKKINEKVKKDG